MCFERLAQQLQFILEIDKLKQVLRQTVLLADKRRENDAEHSWHLAIMAVILAEYATVEVDLMQVLKMLLVHDIVEIDAGDTFAYDTAAHKDKVEREMLAANRLFNLLPAEQAKDLRAAWDEFEARQTPEACYAAALDRLQPMLLNFHGDGSAWVKHAISKEQVLSYNSHMAAGAPALWDYAKTLVEEAVIRGYLKE